jgi:hypothetical protein
VSPDSGSFLCGRDELFKDPSWVFDNKALIAKDEGEIALEAANMKLNFMFIKDQEHHYNLVDTTKR